MPRYKKSTFRFLASVLLTTTIFLIILAGIKVNARWINTFDSYWMKLIHSTIGTHNTAFFRWVTDFGDTGIITWITLVVIGVLFWKRKSYTAIWFLMTVIMGTYNIPRILKRILRRERPMNGICRAYGYSFPSGHSTAATVLYTLVIVLGIIYLKYNWEKIILTVALLTIILLIIYSRIYLGVHYPSDVIGGFFLGISIVMMSMALYYRFTRSRIGTS